MSCGIYIYTNKINNKKYVGQSRNLEKRIYEHERRAFKEEDDEYNSLIHKAFRKYGLKNFLIEVFLIEEEFLNIRETELIKELNSVSPNGYNITFGGNFSSIPQSLSFEKVNEIKRLLKETSLFNQEIAKKFQVSENTISGINTGYYWNDGLENYPIRERKKIQKECLNCNSEITSGSKSGLCDTCSRLNRRKTDRPEPKILAEMILKDGFEGVGRKYGVSGNSIKKWCESYGMGKLKHEVSVWYEKNKAS